MGIAKKKITKTIHDYTRGFVTLLVFIFLFSAKAQVFTFGDSTNLSQLNLSECQKSDTFTLRIRLVSGTLNSPVIRDTIPAGFVFTGMISNTEILSSSTVNMISGQTILTINLRNQIAVKTINIQFTIRAKCGVSLTSTSFTMGLRLTHTTGAVNRTGVDFAGSVKTPVVLLQPRSTIDISNGTIGSIYSRAWRISNSGSSSYIDTVWFTVIYQFGTSFDRLTVAGVTVAPTSISGDTIRYRIIRNFRNVSSFPGDTLLIRDFFRINQCLRPADNSIIGTYWGCLSSPKCNTQNITATTQTPGLVPNIVSRLVSTRYGCYGGYDTVTVLFINNGAGQASNARLRVDLCYPLEVYHNPDGASTSFFDTVNFDTKFKAHLPYAHQRIDSIVKYGYSRPFWPVTNPIATVYFRRTLMNPGDTIFVRFLRFRGKYDNTLCSYTNNVLNVRATYFNFCKTVDYSLPFLNLAGEYHRYFGKTGYNGPAYLANGDTGTFEFQTIKGGSFNHFNQTNDFLLMKITLPAGMRWDRKTAPLTLSVIGSAFTKTVDSVYYDSVTNVFEAYYKNLSFINGIIMKPRFFLRCALAGGGGVKKFNIQYFMLRMIDRCGWQSVPLSCSDDYPITLACPVATARGGVLPFFAKIERTTFGLPDNNNDGIPDGSGSLDFSKIEINKFAPRDTFKLTYRGRITRGSASPSGNFTYGYGRVYFPDYGDLVQILDAQVTVKDQSAGSTFTVTGLPNTRNDTSRRTGIVFNYSGNLSGFPSGFYYDNGDSFTFVARFVWNRNVVEGSVVDNALTTTNNFYVSHLNNPSNDTARYRAFYLPTNFRVVQVYKGYNGGFVNRPTGCNQVRVYSDFFQSIGDCCANYAGSVHFPFEYRLFTTLDTLKIRIPTGYTLDSTNLTYVYTRGAGVAASKVFYTRTPISVVGEWYSFLVTPLYNFAGGTQVPSTTGSYWVMYNYARPSCAIKKDDIQTEFTADRWLGRRSWSGITVRGVANNHNRGTYEYQNAAELDLSNLGSSVQKTTSKFARWDVKIQNNSNTAQASNVWIGFRSKSGAIIVDSVKNLATNTYISQIGGIYRYGPINSGGTTLQLRIVARFTSCVADSLYVYTGWNCAGYPANLNAARGSCRADSVLVYLDTVQTVLQSSLVSAPAVPATLCDTLRYELKVSSRQVGAVYSPYMQIELPAGASIPAKGVVYQYSLSTGTSWRYITPVISGRFAYIYFSDSITQIKNNGLSPINVAGDEIRIKVKFITDCDYISGSSFKFFSYGKKSCGQVLPRDVEYHTVTIAGAPAPKLYITQTIVPIISTCEKDFTIKLSFRNFETGTSVAADKIIVTLPSVMNYVPSSTVFTRNTFTAGTAPTITNFGVTKQLTWVSNGTPSLDSSVFTFKVRSPQNVACETFNDFNIQSVTTYTATCGTSTCASKNQNFGESYNRPVYKPNIKYAAGSGIARIVQDTAVADFWVKDTLSIDGLKFFNFGIDTADKTILTFYYDSITNDTFNVGERIFFKDTLPQIMPSSLYTYDKTKLFGHLTLPQTNLIKVIISQTCNCTANNAFASPPSSYTALDEDLISFTAKLIGDKTNLKWVISSDQSGKNYIVTRKTKVQTEFSDIGAVNSIESVGPTAYVFVDDVKTLPNGLIHYRLRIEKQNGDKTFSKVVSVFKMANGKYISIGPNPASDYITMHIDPNAEGPFKYELITLNGKIAQSEKQIVNYNSTIDLSNIADGIYYLRVTVADEITLHKIVVAR